MKCPQCERPFATVEAVVRHRRIAHHNIPHPCGCKYCDEIFSSWGDRRRHIKEIHEPQDGESQAEGSSRQASKDVSVLSATGSVHESEAKDRAHAHNPQDKARKKHKASGRTVRRIIMGNRTPHTICAVCLRKFRNKKSLDQHREKKGHVILLLEQSRYSKFQCQPVGE
jgi:hypothetical protein